MLWMSLGFSLALLLITNLLIRFSRYLIVAVPLVCFTFYIVPYLRLELYFPAFAWQSVALAILALLLIIFVLRSPRWGKPLYLGLSCLCTVGAYMVLFWQIQQEHEKKIPRFEDWALEDIEERLPSRVPLGISRPHDLAHLEDLEFRTRNAFNEFDTGLVVRSLRVVHEDSVNRFVSRAGFGVSRGIEYKPPSGDDANRHNESVPKLAPVPQPDYLDPGLKGIEIPSGILQGWNAREMLELHDSGVVDFVRPRTFSFALDPQHVFGFRAHGMSQVPTTNEPWSVAHLELVGLLIHEKPIVYQSAHLPLMDDVKKIPTRPLDAFEQQGLEALKLGEDQFYRGGVARARMVGSIRSTRQCIACHGGERGDLLGAFSYSLVRSEKKQK